MSEHLPLRGGTACECGWNYGLSLNDTRSDMKLFLEHYAQQAKAEAWDEGANFAIAQAPPEVWFEDWTKLANPYREGRQ